jgi:4-hydroxybenzoate polyprenyltransferase
MMTAAYPLFQALRPRHWVKQCLVLIPLLLAQKLLDFQALLRTLEAVAVFCLFTSAIYLLNDLVDLESDRRHPINKHRPLAAGLVSPRLGGTAAILLLLLSLAWGAFLGRAFILVMAAYLAVQALYNLGLKKTAILDILCVAASFFLRVLAGAAAIQTPVSRWLIVFSALISTYLALGKCRHELEPRYSPGLLDQMFGVLAACILSSYVVYCTSSETVANLGTDRLIYTLPFVFYAIFRYLYLIDEQSRPDARQKPYVFDPPLSASVLLWALTSKLIIGGVI